MENKILGIHHITAIAGAAQRNYDFYTGMMGLRFVKKTVNFDDPGSYHFYYGNETGAPGTILTFFPWEHVNKGIGGTGMATEIGYSVPAGSLDFWQQRFTEHHVKHTEPTERFGETLLSFEDPDGLNLNLVVPNTEDKRTPWTTKGIQAGNATRGFHNVIFTLREVDATAKVLTDIFGYRLLKQEGDHYRFITDAIETANMVDIIVKPDAERGRVGGGTNHHVAFRVKDEDVQRELREKIVSSGLHITSKVDRNYFYSLYFREPGGVLFEIATDNPGFTADEALNELGTHLKLPLQYEQDRMHIENVLAPLNY